MTKLPQGDRRWVNTCHFMQRGTTPLEVWYGCGLQNHTAMGTVAPGVDTFLAVPFVLSRGQTVDRIACEVTTLAAGAVARIGIYRATSLKNLYPSNLVLDSGEIDCSSNGVKAVTVSAFLSRGVYYACVLEGVGSATFKGMSNVGVYSDIFGRASNLTTAQLHITLARAYGALPAAFPAGAAFAAAGIPLIALRFA